MLSAVVVPTVENETIRLGRDIAGALKLATECLLDIGISAAAELAIHPSNNASRRVAERAGFYDVERRTSNRPFADDVGHVIVYRRNKGGAIAATASEGPRQISG